MMNMLVLQVPCKESEIAKTIRVFQEALGGIGIDVWEQSSLVHGRVDWSFKEGHASVKFEPVVNGAWIVLTTYKLPEEVFDDFEDVWMRNGYGLAERERFEFR